MLYHCLILQFCKILRNVFDKDYNNNNNNNNNNLLPLPL